MKQLPGDKLQRYSLRKSSYGLVSATIASLLFAMSMTPGSQVSAATTEGNIEYRYVAEDELTEQEKTLIITELPKIAETTDDVYYLIYRPESSAGQKQSKATLLPNTGEEAVVHSLLSLAGLGLIVVAIRKGRAGKSEFAGLFVLTVTGSMLLAPSALALTNQTLAQFNQVLSTRVGESLPEPLAITGYHYIGYIKAATVVAREEQAILNTEKNTTEGELEVTTPSQSGGDSELELNYSDSTKTEMIAYTSQEVENAELPVGTRQVSQAGVPGERQIVTREYLVDGEVVRTEVVLDQVTVEAIPEIIQVGTKAVEEVPSEAPTYALPTLDIQESDSSYTEIIAYTSHEVENSDLPEGIRQISQAGVNGEREIVTRTYTVDGQVLKTEEISNQVTVEAIPEIVQVGTKVVEEVSSDAPTHQVPAVELVEADATRTEVIAYETTEVENSDLLAGERVVSQAGVNGERTIVTRTYTVDGQVLKTEEISNQVTVEAIPEIVQAGTKVVEEVPSDAPTHQLPAVELVETDATRTEAIAYEIREVENSDLLAGERVVSQPGVNGERTIVTRTYTVDGQVIKTEEISNQITVEALPEIVQVGTKVVEEVPSDAPTHEVPTAEIMETDTTRTEVIAYETTEVENSNLLAGERVVSQAGVNGERTIVTRTYTVNGQVIKTEEVSNTITSYPVQEIVQVGTKVVEEVPADAPTHQVPTVEIVETDATRTEAIAYEIREVENSDLLAGERVVSQPGVNGERTIVTRTYTVDGQVLKTEEISNQVTVEAIPEIVQVGTKVVEEVPSDAPTHQVPAVELVETDATRTEAIAYEATEVENSDLLAGERVVSQAGVNGERTIVTRTYTVNGQVIKTEEVSNTITSYPVQEIVQVGTKVVEEVPSDAPTHEVPTAEIVETDTTRTEVIAYTSHEVLSADLLEGVRKTSQTGVNGERTIVTRTYTVDGQVVKTEELSNRVTIEAVPEIIQVGTKVVEEVPADAPTHEVPALEIEVNDSTKFAVIPYEVQEVLNNELLKGVYQISQLGAIGQREIVTRTYTVNGQVLKTEEISNQIVKEARPEIIQVGTLVKEVPVLTITSLAEDEPNSRAEASLFLSDPTRSYVSAVAKLYQGETLVRELVIADPTAPLELTDLDYYVDYRLETEVTYDLGLGQGNQTKVQEDVHDFRLEYKKIEIKDIDQLELYGLEDGRYRRYLSLDAAPSDLENYFVKIQSDRFKEMLLPISTVEEVEVDGRVQYKLTVAFDELVQDQDGRYKENYSFYIPKQQAAQDGVYTSFKELIAAMEANPAGQYTIAADMTADEIALAEGATSYVNSVFTGSLTASHNGLSYAIYHLAQPLFNTLSKATIQNVDLLDVAISSSQSTIGALAKTATGSQISNVAVEGALSAPANIGGIVAVANGETKISNSSFTGKLTGTSTSVTASTIGGIVGTATANRTTLSQVQADVDITVSAPNNNYRIGGLVGHLNTNARLENAYVTGDIINLRTTGQVAGAVGSAYWNGIVNNVVSSVNVTNGRMIHGDANYDRAPITNTFVTNQAAGTSEKWSGTILTDEEAASRVAAMGMTVSTTDSLANQASNLYSVDYTKVENALADRSIAYANTEKLLPFYNKEYLVYYANKIAATDKLAQTLLVDVVPMVDNQVVTDPYSQKQAINQIMLHYADNTVAYLPVAFKEDFANNQVSDYSILGTELLYTPETFLANYESTVARLANEMASMAFDSAEVKTVLGITTTTSTPTAAELAAWAEDLGVTATTEQKPLWALYLEDSFDHVKTNLAEQIRKVLAADKAINTMGTSVENYLVEKIARNKEALVLGLAYLNRWYNIDFGDINTRDLSAFKQDFFGNQEASTLDTLIALGKSGYDNLRPRNNVAAFNNSLKKAKSKDDLFTYLESYRDLFLPDKTNNEWLKATSKAYIVESQSGIAEVAAKQATANPESQYTIGVYDRITKADWAYQNMLLPLLTLPDENMYIISNMSTLSFGAYDRYRYDRSAEGRDFTEYMHELVDRAAIWQRDHFDFWYNVLSEESREKLFQSLLNYDGFNFREAANKTSWQTLQDTEFSSIENFFGPVGKWYAANGTGAYANGYLTHFVVDRILDQYGSSVFTHEMVHNFDGDIYFEGNGRRQGQGPELFALGLLQTPNGNQARSLGINTMFTGNEDSLTRYHAANPSERYQSVEDLNTYTHNMFDVIYLLDYLEAKSVLKQSTEVKQKWYRVIDNYYIQSNGEDTHAGNTIRQLTSDEAASLLTINDLVDQSIINRREYWDSHAGLTRNGYYTVSLFSPIYSALSNPNGSPGDVMFRRMAYELMAEKGYVDGFIPYVSNQLGDEALAAGSVIYDEWFKKNVGLITDDMVFDHIFKDEYADWAAFKKAMYQNRIDQVGNLIDFTMTYELDKPTSTKQVAITSFAELEALMDAAVAQDMKSLDTVLANNSSSWVNVLKQRIYNALLTTTNDFTSSIFK